LLPTTSQGIAFGNSQKVKRHSDFFAKHNFNIAGEISAIVYGAPVQMLVDSGASKCAMAQNAFLKLPKACQKFLKPVNAKLFGADQSPLKILGSIEIDIDLQGLRLRHPFLVIKNLVNSFIMGSDLLMATSAKIDYGDRSVAFCNDFIRLPLQSGRQDPSSANVLCLREDLTIPPRSAVLAPIRIPQRFVHVTSVIEALPTTPKQRFGVGNCLVTPTNNSSVVNILNPLNRELRLFKGRPIASIHEAVHVPATSSAPPSSPSSTSPTTSPDVATRDATLAQLGLNYTSPDLSTEQADKIAELLYKNRDVFATSMADLPGTTVLEHDIIVTGPPVWHRPYRHSKEARNAIQKNVTELLQAGLITPSDSLWQSPVILVAKKNTSEARFCIDLRGLNMRSQPNFFPIPSLATVLDVLADKNPSVFSSLDLAQAFWQVPLTPRAQEYCSFVVDSGTFSCKRMAYGLRGASSSFQRLMHTVFRDELHQFLLVYIDDILVFSRSFDSHLQHLQIVFDKIRAASLRLHPKKCKYALRRVPYLGHILSENGIEVDPSKVSKVQEFPRPTSVHQLRQFLGLCNFYRRFVKDYAKIASPLTNLFRNGVSFHWTDQCEAAFQALRNALAATPALAFPRLNDRFILHVDASRQGVGYILSQLDETGTLDRPIEYGGRSLTAAEKKYSITDLEGLSLVLAVRAFHPYLAGSSFTVYTDHISLQWLQSIRASTQGRLARWSLLLQGYDFTICYKPGLKNTAADALSRMEHGDPPPISSDDVYLQDDIYIRPQLAQSMVDMSEVQLEYEEEPQRMAPLQGDDDEHTQDVEADTSPDDVTVLDFPLFDNSQLKTSQQSCLELSPMYSYFETDSLPSDSESARKLLLQADQYTLDDGILFHLYQPRARDIGQVRPIIKQIAVPVALREEVLQSVHDHLAHGGQDRTYLALRARFYWKNMYADSKLYVSSCVTCQQCKRPQAATKAPLHPLPVSEIFQRIHIDFAGPLPTTPKGNKFLLMIIDSLSKWPEIIPVPDQSAVTVAKALYDNIFARFGPPRSILSDRGTAFLSHLVADLCKRFQVRRISTSSFHPATNAQIERQWSVLWASLRATCLNQSDWEEQLSSIAYALRSTPSASSKFSPAMVLYGREMSLPLQTALLPTATGRTNVDSYLKDLLPRIHLTRRLAAENIKAAQTVYKQYYDRDSRPKTYDVGDLVWLHDSYNPPGVCSKLRRKYVGPFVITARSDNDTYRIRDTVTNKAMGSAIHVNRLRPYVHGRETLMERYKELMGHATNGDSDEDEEVDDIIDSTPPSGPYAIPSSATHPVPNATTDNGTASSSDVTLPLPPPASPNPSLTVTDLPTTDPNHASQQPSTSSTTDVGTGQLDTNTDSTIWYPVDRLLKCKVLNGRRSYLVKWQGDHWPATWEPEQNITAALKQHFHTNFTYEGTKRKQIKQTKQKAV